MRCYDEQLRQLQAQCARKKKLEASVEELRVQREAYAAHAQELQQIMSDAQADVERLEGRSLSAFFYNVIGKMDEKLSQERQEAYAARVKYDAAARELFGIEEDLKRYEAELDSLQGCEDRYASILREKTAAVKAGGGSTAEKILQLEEREGYLMSQKQELQEALDAGSAALSCADQILSELDSAEGWGTWDLVGGGLITDMVKHSHLDEAQASVEALQTQLRRFKTELADVTIDADIQVSIDGFLRVADYFFDGIFADWAVLDQIHQSQEPVSYTHLKKRLKLRLVPLPGLLQCIAVAAGQQQPQKVRKSPGERMNIVRSNIHRAAGKHHLPKAADQAVMDAIHTRPADDFGPLGGAEIGLIPGALIKAQGCQVNALFCKIPIGPFHCFFLVPKHYRPAIQCWSALCRNAPTKSRYQVRS